MDPSMINAAMAAMVQPNTPSAIPPMRSPNKTDFSNLAIKTESNDGNSASAIRKPVRFAALAPVKGESDEESSHERLRDIVDLKSPARSADGDTASANTVASKLRSGAQAGKTISMEAAQAVEDDNPDTSGASTLAASSGEVANPISSRLQSKNILDALAADNGYLARATNAAAHSRVPVRSNEKSGTTDALLQNPSRPSVTGEQPANSELDATPQNSLLSQQDGIPHQSNEGNEAKHRSTELVKQQGGAASSSQDLSHKTGNSGQIPAIQAGTNLGDGSVAASSPDPSSPENDLVASVQNVDTQQVAMVVKKEIEGASSLDGTGAALSKPRMKFAGEKNDIAGAGAQKVPSAAANDSSPDSLGAKAKPQTAPSLPKQTGDSIFPGSLAYFSANAALTEGVVGKGHGFPQITDSPASQVERVAHLIGQEVLMVRQSGANALAVSLKVDTHTELFLQLTNHDGQVQASLRCERGSIDHLGEHWTELQQSLARQNVQLMPLEDKTSIRGAVAVTPASGSVASRPFDQSSQNRQQPQLRDPQGETLAPHVSAPGRVSGKTKTNNRSRQGWETWA